MIGISDDKEELYEVYLDWCTRISQTNVFTDQQLMDEYAQEIYFVLLNEADQ
jgi:hypothetical protein